MDASLDTNVIIHLYKAKMQNIMIRRFNHLVVHAFIRITELAHHADPEIIYQIDTDVKNGTIELLNDHDLAQIGMLGLFRTYVREMRILYDSKDLGEVYAIALARTMGCMCLVTDDIKDRGPHYTLMRTADSDIIPFAFYELLFLDYLDGQQQAYHVRTGFDAVCTESDLVLNFEACLKKFIRRFWVEPYRTLEKEWMRRYCGDKEINAKKMLMALRRSISD